MVGFHGQTKLGNTALKFVTAAVTVTVFCWILACIMFTCDIHEVMKFAECDYCHYADRFASIFFTYRNKM
jgi:hypothetical protein